MTEQNWGRNDGFLELIRLGMWTLGAMMIVGLALAVFKGICYLLGVDS